MSNAKNGNRSVADNARREAKLLAKTTKLSVSPYGDTDITLKQPFPKELGEFAAVVIVTPMTSMQFTIARPIGITDLDKDSDWVAHRADQIKGMLARASDPGQSTLNQTRTNFRLSLAVSEKLLVEKDQTGKKAFFYPELLETSRNDFINLARSHADEMSKEIKKRIASLTEDNKGEKQGLLTELQRHEDPIRNLPDKAREAETKLREFWKRPETIALVEKTHPQEYRTLSGPFYTEPQVAISNAKGKRLEDVAASFGRSIATGLSAVTPRGGPAAPKTPKEISGKLPEAAPDTGTTNQAPASTEKSDKKKGIASTIKDSLLGQSKREE